MKPRIYLAAGWFDPAQLKQMEEIRAVLCRLEEDGKLTSFAPFYNGVVLKGKVDPNWRREMKRAWELDIWELSRSDLVVGSTQNHDVGTIFECGYASALKIPILCYNSAPELGLNVMLSQESRGFCKSPAQLLEALQGFVAYCNSPNYGDGTWRHNLWQGEPI
jgi:nucleoside 2-deoxyribosyltransferase